MEKYIIYNRDLVSLLKKQISAKRIQIKEDNIKTEISEDSHIKSKNKN